MIGGLIVDALVLAAIFAFERAGPKLVAADALRRALCCLIGFLGAILGRDPVGWILHEFVGGSRSFDHLVAMLVSGFATYFAATRLVRWRAARRRATLDAEESEEADDVNAPAFDHPWLEAADGAFLGLAWAVTFVALLVLLPSDNLLSRSASNSFTGRLLIRQESCLRWLTDGFPRYTQTLPKGSTGAVVGPHESIPMQGDAHAVLRPRDADELLAATNDSRRSRDVQVMSFNRDIADVAERHAMDLAAEHTMSYETSGGTLDGQVGSALGEAAGSFATKVGVEVVWAHSPQHAAQGLRTNTRAIRLITDPKWTEIGIGVADAGWFNGRIYVLLLVQPAEQPPDTAAVVGDTEVG